MGFNALGNRFEYDSIYKIVSDHVIGYSFYMYNPIWDRDKIIRILTVLVAIVTITMIQFYIYYRKYYFFLNLESFRLNTHMYIIKCLKEE